jgi:putative radical SAM-modified peptide
MELLENELEVLDEGRGDCEELATCCNGASAKK